MRVVILAGGLGTRMREETEAKPKPMVQVGDRPIIWHIVRYFFEFGFTDFVVLAGYKAEMISDYFSDLDVIRNELNDPRTNESSQKLNIRVLDTGEQTPTGGRLFLARKLIGTSPFVCVYGDTLADVNLRLLKSLSLKNPTKNIVTVTRPTQRFGIVEVDENGLVRSFREKPVSDDLVSIGFFVLQPRFLDSLSEDSTLEEDPLRTSAKNGNFLANIHNGYWKPMDTYRELLELQKLWQEKRAPWKVWE